MYLYGASGHAKVIIDILHNTGIPVSGLFDDNPHISELQAIKVIGKYSGQKLDEDIIISIGDNTIRAKIAHGLNSSFGKAVHKSAIISPDTVADAGTVVMQGAIIQAGTKIGKHVIINTGASIDHDCCIEDFAHISPGAVLCGNVQIGEGTQVGASAVIIPNIKIGKWCKIGAGAVVIKDVPDFCTAVGNPIRILNKINDEL